VTDAGTDAGGDIRKGGGAACVILARGGSKGLPGKNLRRLGGLSLVARAVRAGRAARGVDGVWVSTDDAAIAAEARLHGARVVARPAALAGDAASSESGWLHALGAIRAGGGAPERLVFLQCTSPFTTGPDIDRCLAAMAARGADCALSVAPSHVFLWGEDADGSGRGVNHDAALPRARRQDLPPQWAETGAVYCVRTEAFERVGRRFCGRVALCPLEHPALEIDDASDLALCARMLGGEAPAPARLRALRAVVTDFDGVHTDDRVAVDQDGREAVRCSRGDGLGLERLRAGRPDLALLILSKERNPVVGARAAKLGIEALAATDDKVAALDAWLAARAIPWEAVLFVGNDVNDAGAMARAGLSACPEDARPSVAAAADWVLPRPGGRGALREMAEALLAASGPERAPAAPGRSGAGISWAGSSGAGGPARPEEA
jgi:N-acylneuraminate cytidylyltransferase